MRAGETLRIRKGDGRLWRTYAVGEQLLNSEGKPTGDYAAVVDTRPVQQRVAKQ